MPIMLEHRWLYPIAWPELSKIIRSGRGKGHCEHCCCPPAKVRSYLAAVAIKREVSDPSGSSRW